MTHEAKAPALNVVQRESQGLQRADAPSNSSPERGSEGRLAWESRAVRRVGMPPEGELELMNRSPISMVPSPTLTLRRGRLPPRLLGVGPADPQGRTATRSCQSALVIISHHDHAIVRGFSALHGWIHSASCDRSRTKNPCTRLSLRMSAIYAQHKPDA